jgi:hypothetical protein
MLNDLKLMLGIPADDKSLDEKLKLLISTATARLRLLLGGVEPPASMDYIIREVSIIRYNKIGSEGLGSHTVEGESLTFNDDDFAAFADEIQAYLDTQKESKRGRVRFL